MTVACLPNGNASRSPSESHRRTPRLPESPKPQIGEMRLSESLRAVQRQTRPVALARRARSASLAAIGAWTRGRIRGFRVKANRGFKNTPARGLYPVYPTHPDENPSWRWDQGNAWAHCTCIERTHSIFDVVAKLEGINFDAAKVHATEVRGWGVYGRDAGRWRARRT